jgi:trans-aconitate 2-methyltransferase
VPSDWDAASYDRVSDPQVRWAENVIERIEGSPERILDAGCGSGRVTEMLVRTFPDAHVIGIDASKTMIAEAERRFAGSVELIHADLLNPFPLDEPVDVAFSNAVFHWVDDHDTLFRNIANALRVGGRLVAQWGGQGNVKRLLEAADATGFRGPHPRRFVGAEETDERLRRSGFDDIRVWLHDDHADFATREEFVEYLRTVCLRCHLDLVPQSERDAFINGVADRLPDRRVDYVRINATARRAVATT